MKQPETQENNPERPPALAGAHGSAWRECAKAWRKMADDMYDSDPELARRAMARAETFEYCANSLETETPNIVADLQPGSLTPEFPAKAATETSD
jgi:hypothetical protein